MDFKYRYVPFGTVFQGAAGPRCADAAPELLFENEVAVDVGGQCVGYAGCELPILDHHFRRTDERQFPSAAAVVLHHASMLHARFAGKHATVWLVTHREPDFDAFCAMYLVRRLLQDHNPLPAQGWEEHGVGAGWLKNAPGAINWFQPQLPAAAEFREPLLWASYASHVDAGRKMSVPKHLALHSVLYAALRRGRHYQSSGATEYFEAAAREIVRRGLNPLLDSVLERTAEFEPEIRMLEQELARYERDLRRARKVIVALPVCPDFAQRYPKLAATPLFTGAGQINPVHLNAAPATRQADGIYIRDPECLLFKEWARSDIENSSFQQGFLFTAVAMSNGRPGAALNTSDYFFALDPERAADAHLYPVWAQLQAHEADALRHRAGRHRTAPSRSCRLGYEQRAGQEKELFSDPWFDGANYGCTIVATPNEGSRIGCAGLRSDLSDDPVAALVREQLELGFFATPVRMRDASLTPGTIPEEKTMAVQEAVHSPWLPLKGFYRFVAVGLRDDVNVQHALTAEQIGRLLWDVLHGASGDAPADFVGRHLLVAPDSVAVWSRRGIAIAYRQGEATQAKMREVEHDLHHIIDLVARVSALSSDAQKLHASETAISTCDELVREMAELKRRLALPEGRLLRQFFEASQLNDTMNVLRDLHHAALSRKQSAQLHHAITEIEHTQKNVEWVELFIVAVYAVELVEKVGQGVFAHGYIHVCIVIAMLAAPLIAGYILEPRKGAHEKLRTVWQKRLALLFCGVLIAVYLCLGYCRWRDDKHPTQAPTEASAPASKQGEKK